MSKNKDFLNTKIAFFMSETRLQKNEDKALEVVGEILFWACSTIDNHSNRTNLEKNNYVKAIKYIRNRVSHNFIEVLKIDYKGATFPIQLPTPFFEIKWKSINEIGKDTHKYNRNKEPFYEQNLQDKPVRFVLEELKNIL